MYAGSHGVMSLWTSIYPLINIFNFVAGIVFYVLSGIGYYNMANNTGVKNAWMAWVPFCREYLMGSLADRYNANSYGKQSKLRIILTVLNAIVIPIVFIFTFAVVFTTVLSIDNHYGGYSWMSLMWEIIFYSLLVMALAIACKVFYLISYYKTFQDFEPANATLYTVIAFFGFGSIPVFMSRNNVPVGIAGRCSPKQPQYNVNSSNFNGFNNYNNPNQSNYTVNPNQGMPPPPPAGSPYANQGMPPPPPAGSPYANQGMPPPPSAGSPYANQGMPPPPSAGSPYANQGMPPPPPPSAGSPYANQGMPPPPPPQDPTPTLINQVAYSTSPTVNPIPDPELELPKVSVTANSVKEEAPPPNDNEL